MTTDDTTARIAAIEARAAAATPGPWQRNETWSLQPASRFIVEESGALGDPRRRVTEFLGIHDAEFIAHSRADVPWLLTQLKTAREEVMAQRSNLSAAYEPKIDALKTKLVTAYKA